MTGLPAILCAAYEMGGVTGWTVLVLLGVLPAGTFFAALWRLKP